MKLISFYTKNTIYEKEIEDLAASCQTLGIDHYIEAREDLGSWETNCSQKPLFIYECLQRFNEPLLWVDADGIAFQKPQLHLGECDLGLYFNNKNTLHARNATIYVSPTENAKAFLQLWYETLLTLNARPNRRLTPDQPVMISLIRKKTIPLKIGELPLAYMQIFDRDKVPLDQTVILHFQASRTARMAPLFWQQLTGRELKAMRLAVSRLKNVEK
ncbi:MAG: putative nucleotide-diphospho-sugar transferase [Chlamydiales bacterium]